jgi:germination protein M
MSEDAVKRRRRWLRRCSLLAFGSIAFTAVLGLALALAGCGGSEVTTSSSAGTTTTASQTTTTPGQTTTTSVSTTTSGVTTVTSTSSTSTTVGTITLSIYLVQNEKVTTLHRIVPRTEAVAQAAVNALLAGPTAEERTAGISAAIPGGVKLLGLTIKDGVATINLSGQYASGGGSLSTMLRLAQVVYTLTQFTSVRSVSFQLDGEPVTVFGSEGLVIDRPQARTDFEDVTPAILVDSPVRGDTIKSPVHGGTANVFEAVLEIQVLDKTGIVLVQQTARASAGTVTRGVFDVTVPLDITASGPGSLIAFSSSPKDGSRINQVTIPVLLQK